MNEHKTPEVPKENKDNSQAPSQAPPNKDKEKNPFGEGVKPAMYILFDEAKKSFFVVSAPGFLDEPERAYGALKIAEKNLDEFYKTKDNFRKKFLSGIASMTNKINMRNFLRGR